MGEFCADGGEAAFIIACGVEGHHLLTWNKLFVSYLPSSAMIDFDGPEDLSEELIEDLKVKGLHSFVVVEQSTNSAIKLLVYENEKYRSIVREWGSAVGIHILPPLDRRPFTDDLGKHSIRY